MILEKDSGYRKAKADCKTKILKVIKLWNAREETIHDVSFKEGVKYGYKSKHQMREQWIYEALSSLLKEPTKENARIIAKTIYMELLEGENV